MSVDKCHSLMYLVSAHLVVFHDSIFFRMANGHWFRNVSPWQSKKVEWRSLSKLCCAQMQQQLIPSWSRWSYLGLHIPIRRNEASLCSEVSVWSEIHRLFMTRPGLEIQKWIEMDSKSRNKSWFDIRDLAAPTVKQSCGMSWTKEAWQGKWHEGLSPTKRHIFVLGIKT